MIVDKRMKFVMDSLDRLMKVTVNGFDKTSFLLKPASSAGIPLGIVRFERDADFAHPLVFIAEIACENAPGKVKPAD